MLTVANRLRKIDMWSAYYTDPDATHLTVAKQFGVSHTRVRQNIQFVQRMITTLKLGITFLFPAWEENYNDHRLRQEYHVEFQIIDFLLRKEWNASSVIS